MVLACEAELVDELFGVLRHASSGLYRKGKEVRLLCPRQLLVLVVLAQCGLVGGGEGLGAGCRQMRGSKRMRDDDIGRISLHRTVPPLT